MFENVGKKIKGLCKIVFIVLVSITVISAIYIIASMIITDNAEFKDYLVALLVCVLIIGVGTLLAWLTVLFLYAFGELVDTNQIAVEQNEQIIDYLSKGKKTTKKQKDKQTVNFTNTEYGQIFDISNEEGEE